MEDKAMVESVALDWIQDHRCAVAVRVKKYITELVKEEV